MARIDGAPPRNSKTAAAAWRGKRYPAWRAGIGAYRRVRLARAA